MPANKTEQIAKDYVTVAERIEKFYELWPTGRILTEVIEHDPERGFVLVKAFIFRGESDTQPSATGHAYELKSEGFVNRTSYIENCETSAVGRGLALLGFEIKRGIASAEEMQKVARHQAEEARVTEEQLERIKQLRLDLKETGFFKSAEEVTAHLAKFSNNEIDNAKALTVANATGYIKVLELELKRSTTVKEKL